ncbi:MAG: NYN domain-containing protein [Firmicutes bacterium]|nr:NYN domain-containing protein [Bacillota bacterium]
MYRVMVFIDGNNFEAAITGLYGGVNKLDYKKLAELVAKKVNGFLIRFYYYKCGILKGACDSNIILSKAELDTIKR